MVGARACGLLSPEWIQTQELVVAVRTRRHVKGWQAGEVAYFIFE